MEEACAQEIQLRQSILIILFVHDHVHALLVSRGRGQLRTFLREDFPLHLELEPVQPFGALLAAFLKHYSEADELVLFLVDWDEEPYSVGVLPVFVCHLFILAVGGELLEDGLGILLYECVGLADVLFVLNELALRY